MKKNVIILLILMMTLALVACSSEGLESKWETDQDTTWEFNNAEFFIAGKMLGTYSVDNDVVTIEFIDETSATFTYVIEDDTLRTTAGGMTREFKRTK